MVGPATPIGAPTPAPPKPNTTPQPTSTTPDAATPKTYAPEVTEPTTAVPPLPGIGTSPGLGPEPSPLTPGAGAKEPAPEPPLTTPRTSTAPTREDSGLLTIYVPADAKVTINGLATRSKGSKRQYVSYGLQPGYSYKYEVRAEVVRDGRALEEARTIVMTAGGHEAVAFGFNPAQYEDLAANQ